RARRPPGARAPPCRVPVRRPCVPASSVQDANGVPLAAHSANGPPLPPEPSYPPAGRRTVVATTRAPARPPAVPVRATPSLHPTRLVEPSAPTAERDCPASAALHGR